MTCAIIGSGHVGTALAHQFARNGIAVMIANTRGPDSINELVNDLGPLVVGATLHDALEADTILLAVPFAAHAEIAKSRSDWSDKTVIDATNFRETDLAPLGGLQSSDFVAKGLPRAKVVKTFNQLPADILASNPVESSGRRVMFIAGNHDSANTDVASLVASLGFAPIILGKVAEGGRLLRFRGPLVLQNLFKLGA